MKYVGMLSVALCLDRGLSLVMSAGIWHCQGLWFLVSYNYFHRFLHIWFISTSFYLNRLLGSSTVVFFVFCDLDWGWGGGELLSYIWALWLCVAMGNIDGEMDSVGNACVQTLPDTNSVSVLLNYGIIFPSVPYYQSVEGVGGPWSCLPASHTFFHHFLSPSHPPPPRVWGLGRHMTFQTRVMSFISKVRYSH